MKKTRAFSIPVEFGLNTNNKFKKKKKIRGGGNNIIISDPSSTTTTTNNNNNSKSGGIVIDGDLVVHEILTRLPVKSLIRFKSVCKPWNIIHKDPNFIDLHLNRSKLLNPSLFIIPSKVPPTYTYTLIAGYALDRGPLNQLFMTANLTDGGGGAFINTVRDSSYRRFDTISNPVNGLICFIDSQKRNTARIYNISTRKRSPWIKNLLKKGEKPLNGSMYQFGFDPATNQHKLVCLRRLSSPKTVNYFRLVCDVLTVGGEGVPGRDDNTQLNEWRRIDEVPPQSVDIPSVYVNGSIYWSTKELNNGGKSWKGENRPVFIVAFDVGSEKFRTIQVPDFILDQPRENCEYGLSHENIGLLEVDGRLALQIKMNSHYITLWIFNDEKIENMTTTSLQNWTQVTMKLPFSFEKGRFVHLHSVLDKIILTIQSKYSIFDRVKPEKYVSFYSYNRKKNIFEELEISGIPTDICSIWLLTKFHESLLSVPTEQYSTSHHEIIRGKVPRKSLRRRRNVY